MAEQSYQAKSYLFYSFVPHQAYSARRKPHQFGAPVWLSLEHVVLWYHEYLACPYGSLWLVTLAV